MRNHRHYCWSVVGIEQSSEHPLAAAIVRGAKDQGIAIEAVEDFRSVTAGGVIGTVSGRLGMIGKPAFLRNEKVSGLEPLEASAAKLPEEGKTAMFAAIDGRRAGGAGPSLANPHRPHPQGRAVWSTNERRTRSMTVM